MRVVSTFRLKYSARVAGGPPIYCGEVRVVGPGEIHGRRKEREWERAGIGTKVRRRKVAGGKRAWLFWGTRPSVAVGAVPFDHGVAGRRRSSPAWNGALASQVYV